MGGVLIGMMLKSFYDRASPKVSLIEIRTSLEANKIFPETGSMTVLVSDDLREAAKLTFWSSFEGLEAKNNTYEAFTAVLDRNAARVSAFLAGEAGFRRDVGEMRKILADEATDTNLEKFFDYWTQNQDYIYGSLRGKFRRQQFKLAQRDYSGETRRLVLLLENNEYYVRRVAGRLNSRMSLVTDADAPLQKEVAYSLAYYDRKRIFEYLGVVESESMDVTAANRILEEVSKARESISRITATIEVQNSGATSISFLPYATLKIYAPTDVANGRASDTPIQLRFEFRSLASGEPEILHIPGHSAQLAKFATAELVQNIANYSMIMDRLRSPGAACRLTLVATGFGLLNAAAYESEPAACILQ